MSDTNRISIPTNNLPHSSTGAPSADHERTDTALTTLGLLAGVATPASRRQALSQLQRQEGLPETGRLDGETRAALGDALRRHQSMLRNAAAAGRGGALYDASGVMAEAGSLAMMRFANVNSAAEGSIPTEAGSARQLGRNLRGLAPAALVDRAQRLQGTLDRVHVGDGEHRDHGAVATRRAALTSLMALYDEMDRRVTRAPSGEDNLPQLEGVQWQSGSPLAGTTMDLQPFGQRDIWAAELASLPAPRHRPSAHAPRPSAAPTTSTHREPGTPSADLPPPDLDLDEARRMLTPPEHSSIPGWTGVAAEVGHHATVELLAAMGAEGAAFVGEALGPFVTTAANIAELIGAWGEADHAMEWAGRTFGAEFGMEAAMMDSDAMRRAVADGHLTTSELAAIVHSRTSIENRWTRQIAFGGAARQGLASRAMTRGVAIAAGVLQQALDQASARLDELGIHDPAERQRTLAHAVNQGAEAGFQRLHAHNEAVREQIRAGE